MIISRKLTTSIAIILSICTITGCGGGGSSGTQPTLTITSLAPKQLLLVWDTCSGAASYDVKCSPDGSANFVAVPGATGCTEQTFTADIAVHLTDWKKCQYLVEGYTDGGTLCATIAPQSLTQVMSSRATGYLKAPCNETGDSFGSSVSISGDGKTLVVGASFEDGSSTGVGGSQTDNGAASSGAAYVFVYNDGSWSLQAYVKASNTGSSDHFGYCVVLSRDGNTLAVGAPGERSNATGIDGDQTNNSIIEAGAVYVFKRTGTTWAQEAYIKASNTSVNDLFGLHMSLSSDGNTLAVGVGGEDCSSSGINGDDSNNSLTNSGAVFLFTRSGATWSQQAYFKAPYSDAYDQYGSAVALSSDGNLLAIGSPNESSSATGMNGDQNNNGDLGSGAIFVYERVGAVWSLQAYIKASQNGEHALGTSLSFSDDGNTLAAGATSDESAATGINGDESDTSAYQAGALYIFVRSGSNWSQQAYIKASNTNAGECFGQSVSISADGNTVATGTPKEQSAATGINGDDTDNSADEAGAVYVFTRSGTTWSQKSYVKAPNSEAGDEFGSTLALNGDGQILVVGAQYEDGNGTGLDGDISDNSAFSAGAAYLY